jgi:hypothetical protein
MAESRYRGILVKVCDSNGSSKNAEAKRLRSIPQTQLLTQESDTGSSRGQHEVDWIAAMLAIENNQHLSVLTPNVS